MKSSVTLQDRLVKQNEISRQKLAQELVKLEKVEKSDLRMIETERHRFLLHRKNLETRRQSSGSNAINVRMYETHNPGFCYHCTGAIKENGPTTKKQPPKDSYEFVRSILFTNDVVDPWKVLCLHLLTAHSTRWNDNDESTVRPVTALLEKAKNKQFSGAWNNILPCYVVDTEESWRRGNVKLHEDPRKLNLEDQTIRDFEEKYKQYMDNNVDFGRALSTNAKHTKIALQGFEKMPTISPHVYSLLGPSHELRIKQALAEGVTRKKLAHSSMELNGLNENSLSFRLDEDDDFSSRTTTASNKNWLARSTRSPSRRSTMESSVKVDRGITMLKSKRCKPKDHAAHDASKLITIKPSFGALKKTLSKTSSTKSPFRGMLESRPSTNSLLSTNLSPETTRKYRKCVYLNTPVRCVQFRSRDHKTVPVLVNYQIQALVQAVLEVLERVNPEKSRIIIETARDTEEIRRILLRPEVQSFVQSLLGQSLVSSPESYVVSTATLMDEIDCRFEGILEKEIIALTLEMPLTPSLDALISEIRSNIFLDAKKKPQMNENTKEIASSSNGRKVEKTNDVKDAKVTQADERKQDNEMPRVKEAKKYSPKKQSPKIKKAIKRARNGKRNSPKANETNKLQKPKSGEETTNSELSNPTSKGYPSKISKEENVSKFKQPPKKNSKAADEQVVSSDNVHAMRTLNAKTWKAAQNHLDADHVILRRMTNTQRILVGQMCASLKSKRINNQGLINESVPLAALITPALSRDSIKLLTRGTMYAKTDAMKKQHDGVEDNVTVPDKLTGPLLAKIRQNVAENETKQRLKYFLK